MKKHSILYVMTILIFILTACAGNTPVSAPTVDPSAVAAVVATMLAGIPTATLQPEPTATLTPEPQTLLPHSLYYLAQDSNGIGQIFRLSRDGATITQITFEPDWILNFDISPIDSTIAYPTQNSLITVDANGENRQVLAQDPNIRFSIAWSPDGRTIAYGDRDTALYSLATGNSEILIASSDGVNIMSEAFSPDGTKMIISTSRKHKTRLILNDISRAPQAFNRTTEQECQAAQG